MTDLSIKGLLPIVNGYNQISFDRFSQQKAIKKEVFDLVYTSYIAYKNKNDRRANKNRIT